MVAAEWWRRVCQSLKLETILENSGKSWEILNILKTLEILEILETRNPGNFEDSEKF